MSNILRTASRIVLFGSAAIMVCGGFAVINTPILWDNRESIMLASIALIFVGVVIGWSAIMLPNKEW